MKIKTAVYLGMALGLLALGYAKSRKPEWQTARKIAGPEQGLSHISALVVDGGFGYVLIGGTIADQNAGTSGLRKIDLATGAVTKLAPEQVMTQSDQGGLATDGDFVYWNGLGKILRIPKQGGTAQVVVDDKIGMGLDLVVDDQHLYWANHGYYSPNTPSQPTAIYRALKSGGPPEVFAPDQDVPHGLVADEQFLYWVTPSSVRKQAKSGGQPQILVEVARKEGVSELAQHGGDLFFGFRGANKSRWALRKVSKQGGEVTTLVPKYSRKPVTITDSSVYFFDEAGMSDDVLCKVARQGGPVTQLDKGYATGVITQDRDHIYMANQFFVYAFQK